MSTPQHTLESFAEGKLLLINKPYKWTSFDVVGKLRNAFKPMKLKVGHAGTLDPLATGLLIVCTGKMTKQIDTFQAEEKEYTGTLMLGATTPSYDMETEVDETFDFRHITEADITNAAQRFIGEIQQYPPAHSAIKVGGERLYEKARRGEEVELKSRTVTISEFEITGINFPEISFRVVCSKGTYIRSLVYDFGKVLDNGAYLSKLRRTRSGNFKIEDAHEIMQLVGQIRELKTGPHQEYAAEMPHPRPPRELAEGQNRVERSPLPNPSPKGGLHDLNDVTIYRETANTANYRSLKDFILSNRQQATKAEEVLWQLLRKDSLGYKVRRQHIIEDYIVDFVCLKKTLVIEVDGGYHLLTKEEDQIRTEVLNDLGFEVIRFSNEEVLKNPSSVLEHLRKKIEERPNNDPDKALPSGEGWGGAS